MGHKETVTAAVKALRDHDKRREQLMQNRNDAIRAAGSRDGDEVPAAAISRWTGLSEPHVRRLIAQDPDS